MTDEKPEEAGEPEIPVEVVVEEPAVSPTVALEKEKKELHERLLRTAADFDNFRKRSRKDIEEARTKGKEDVLKEMLPVIDNLERALGAAETQQGGGIVEGVKLVLRQFVAALERFEVKPVTALGEAFDPARHEAIAQIPTADQPAGTVVSELQKGYTLGARLLRAAMVAVARAPEAPKPATTEEGDATPADDDGAST
jgi:molecular chaperone GrpE